MGLMLLNNLLLITFHKEVLLIGNYCLLLHLEI